MASWMSVSASQPRASTLRGLLLAAGGSGARLASDPLLPLDPGIPRAEGWMAVRQTVTFATNRTPEGDPPRGFGPSFNPVHPHELRFGAIALEALSAQAAGSG